jgi:hypothetical protein
MARGFESKSVADQQEQAQNRQRGGEGEPADAAVVLKRRKLELARADVLHQLGAAHVEAHKEMLRRALAALDKDLAAL